MIFFSLCFLKGPAEIGRDSRKTDMAVLWMMKNPGLQCDSPLFNEQRILKPTRKIPPFRPEFQPPKKRRLAAVFLRPSIKKCLLDSMVFYYKNVISYIRNLKTPNFGSIVVFHPKKKIKRRIPSSPKRLNFLLRKRRALSGSNEAWTSWSNWSMVSSFFRIPRLVGSVTLPWRFLVQLSVVVVEKAKWPPTCLPFFWYCFLECGNLPHCGYFFLQALDLKGFSFCYTFM